jgi:four helix bundle protein
MGAREPEQLVAWQLTHELKLRVYEITSRAHVRRDFAYCAQIREAARSGEDNIAEGFWRYGHGDFRRFILIARGSIGEVRNQLGDGADRGHITAAEAACLRALAERALQTTAGLERYLRGSPTPHGRSRRTEPARGPHVPEKE